jgi:hypothetical protein
VAIVYREHERLALTGAQTQMAQQRKGLKSLLLRAEMV